MISGLLATLFLSSLSSTAIQTLQNGTTIAAIQNTTAKRFAIVALIRAGSAYETQETNGVMHLLEHMLFLGSQNIAPGTIDRKAEQKGIRINATTFQEFIKITAEGPAEHWGTGIECLNNLLQKPTLQPEIIASEKRVLKEEIAMQNRDRNRQEIQTANIKVFENTPWAYPTSGTIDVIDQLTKERLLECYEKHFVGANLTVVSVANVTTNMQLHAMNQAFYFLPSGQKTIPPPKPTPQPTSQTEGNVFAFIGPPYEETENWIAVEAIAKWITSQNPSQNRFSIIPSTPWSLVVITFENAISAKETLDQLDKELSSSNIVQFRNFLQATYEIRQSKPNDQAMQLALDIFFTGHDRSEKRNQIIKELNPQILATWAKLFASKNAITVLEP